MHGWWSIADLKENKVYRHWDLPLKMVPCIKEVNINKGHKTTHQDIKVTVGTASADLRTGAIWKNGKPLTVVEKAVRVILFKRVSKDPQTNKLLGEQYFLGLVDVDGNGQLIRMYENKYRLEPFKVGVPVHD